MVLIYLLRVPINLFSAVKVESLGRVLKTKACQGEFLTMSCRKDPRNTIIIFQASYGRDSEVCPYKPGKPLPFKQIFEGEGSKDPLGLQCEEDATKLIDKRCGWKKACDVAVTSSVSDRCGPGANQYLSVAYSCGRVSKVKAHTEFRLMLREFELRKKNFLVLAIASWQLAAFVLPLWPSVHSGRIIPDPRWGVCKVG